MDNQVYKVLARKYRPQKFSEIIGQESLVSILKNSISNNRTAHSYVLTGVRGVGKTTIARLIAMGLNCKERKQKDCEPCGKCESCISIKQDSSMDVIEMDAASKTGVDDVREIIDNVKYKPVNSLYKIFIIDEVHMLSKNAFNALLKTLEEPPEHIKFIFATTEVKKIPITILSRCQRFDLHRIENSVLTNHLLKISELEKIKIDKNALALIVRAADGSVRDGLSLLDQAIANQDDSINAQVIIDMLGLADRGKIFELIDYIFAGKAADSLKLYNDLYNEGADIVMIFDELLNAVHFITQIKISPILKDDIYIPELERIKGFEISSKIELSSLGLIWQILFKGFQELQQGFHLYQHGEMIILRLIYLHNGPSPEDLLKKSNEKNKLEQNNINIESKQTNENLQNKILNKNFEDNKIFDNLNYNNLKSNKPINTFRNFVEMFFKKKEGIIHSKLYNNVKLIDFKEGELTINSNSLNDPHFNRTVAKLISKWTGRIWQIHSSSSNVGNSLYEDDLINQKKEINKMKNNPDIKKILKDFKGSTIHSIADITEITDEKFINNTSKEKEK